MATLDYAIVGGGISGLYVARELAKRHTHAKISVFEKYRVLGGRILTFHDKQFQWEEGAGRIHSSHILTRNLLKEYGLHEIPISDETGWIKTYGSELLPNPFEDSLRAWLPQVQMLPEEILGTHTLYEILEGIFGTTKAKAFIDPFPYRAEVYTLRADLAVRSFTTEMGANQRFSICKEGLDSLIDALANDCKSRGVTLHTHHALENLAPEMDGSLTLWFATGSPSLHDSRTIITAQAKTVICALHADALRKIPIFKPLPALTCVKMEPLHRIYAVFPPGKNGKIWFEDLPKFVTETRLRYFIPIRPDKGIVMISYTDAGDSIVWTNIASGMKPIAEQVLGKLLTDECRRLFPMREIPYPSMVKSHPWSSGATYWTPGLYDPNTLSKETLTPFKDLPNLHICGESFSMRQAWIEGALENSRALLRIL
jgi:glycine/D-amino acid oxidase-like deaminating enzyme